MKRTFFVIGIVAFMAVLAITACNNPINGDPGDNGVTDNPASGVMTAETARTIFDYTVEGNGVTINKFKSATALAAYLSAPARSIRAAGGEVATSTLIIGTIDGKPVTAIGEGAFTPDPENPDTDITSVAGTITFPATITAIAGTAFDNLPPDRLTVEIPQAVIDTLPEEVRKKLEETITITPISPSINPNPANIVQIPIGDYLMTLVGTDGEKRTALTQANNWGKAAEVLGYSSVQGLVNALLPMIRAYHGYEVTAVAMYDRNADGAYVAITASTPFTFAATALAYVELENLPTANPVNIVGTWVNATDPAGGKYVFTDTGFEWYSTIQSAPNTRGTYTLNSTAIVLTVISSEGTTTTETLQFSIDAMGSTIYLNNVAYNKQTGTNPNPAAPVQISIINQMLYLANNDQSKLNQISVGTTWNDLLPILQCYTSFEALRNALIDLLEANYGKEVVGLCSSDQPVATGYPPITPTTVFSYTIYVVWGNSINPNPTSVIKGTWLGSVNGDVYVFGDNTFQYSTGGILLKQGTYTVNSAMLTLTLTDGTIETYQFSINATGNTIHINNLPYDKQTGTTPNPSVPEVLYVKNYLSNIAMNASSGTITDIDALLTQAGTWRGLWYNIGGYINSLDDLLTDLKDRIETDRGKEISVIYASNVPNSNNTYPPIVDSTPLGSVDPDGTTNPTNPVIYVLWE